MTISSSKLSSTLIFKHIKRNSSKNHDKFSEKFLKENYFHIPIFRLMKDNN